MTSPYLKRLQRNLEENPDEEKLEYDRSVTSSKPWYAREIHFQDDDQHSFADSEGEEEELAWQQLEKELKIASGSTKNDLHRDSNSSVYSLNSHGTSRVHLHRTGSIEIQVEPDILDSDAWSKNGERTKTAPTLLVSPGRGTSILNHSFASTTRLGDNSTRSASVVSAMQALQAKVKALESERTNLNERIVQLEAQIESMRRENISLSKDGSQALSRKDKELASLHEKHSQEVLNLNTRAVAAEEQVRGLKKELEHVKDKANHLQAEKTRLESKVSPLENRIRHLETELNGNHENSSSKIHELESQLKAELERTAQLQSKQVATEDFCRSVVSLNEELVTKLSSLQVTETNPRKTRKRTAATKKRSSRKSTQSPSRNLMRSTVAIRAKRRQPLEMKNMFKGNLHEQLVSANDGEEVPFLLGTSTNESFSIYGQAQTGLSDDAAYGIPAKTLAGKSRDVKSPDRFMENSMESPTSPNCSSHSISRDRTENSEQGLTQVLHSLEAELAELNATYKSLLADISQERTGDESVATTEEAEAKSRLDRLVQQIEVKAQQLYMLRKYQHVSSSKIRGRSPMRSPDAYNRKVNSLRALHQFKMNR